MEQGLVLNRVVVQPAEQHLPACRLRCSATHRGPMATSRTTVSSNSTHVWRPIWMSLCGRKTTAYRALTERVCNIVMEVRGTNQQHSAKNRNTHL